MGRLDGKVAFITGAARGQGRSHALRLAEEGADIIALDLLDQIATIDYAMSTPDDMKETVRLVEALGRRIHFERGDVRDMESVHAVYQAGVTQLGPVDIIVANAGICPIGSAEPDPLRTFNDVIDINLRGAFNTAWVAAHDMIERDEGGSVVLISSTQGLTGRGADGSAAATGYAAAKHGVVGLMHSFANWLSPHNIRVNSIHPTGVMTPMVDNDVMANYLARNERAASMAVNLMPVDAVSPVDISNAILFLASDEGRYITGVSLPVDAGFVAR